MYTRSSFTATLLVASLLLALPVAYAQTILQRTIPNTGTINRNPELGVYSDETCTKTIASLDWGTCEPGKNKTQKIYVRNEATANVTFTIEPSNWNPTEAQQYLSVTSNSENYTLTPQQTAAITLTLTVDPKITVNSFAFDIDIIYSN